MCRWDPEFPQVIGMDDEQIRSLVRQLDTRDAAAQDIIWTQLRPLGEKVVEYLAEFYPKARTLEGRRALVFHSIKYARARGRLSPGR